MVTLPPCGVATETSIEQHYFTRILVLLHVALLVAGHLVVAVHPDMPVEVTGIGEGLPANTADEAGRRAVLPV